MSSALPKPKDFRMVFVDLDDTLFRASARIGIRKDGQTIKTISTQEFTTWRLNDGEEFDFREFTSAKIFEQSVPLVKNIEEIFTKYKDSEIAVLTARGDLDDPELFLQTLRRFGIPAGHYKDGKVHVIRCAVPGQATPVSKMQKLRRILSKRPDVKEIIVIDDSVDNLRAIANSNIPVRIKTILAHADGLTEWSLRSPYEN